MVDIEMVAIIQFTTLQRFIYTFKSIIIVSCILFSKENSKETINYKTINFNSLLAFKNFIIVKFQFKINN